MSSTIRTSMILGIALLALAQRAEATVLADTVRFFFGGTGYGVIDRGDSWTGPVGEKSYDPLAVTRLDGAALALGGTAASPGQIILAFSGGSVLDDEGADLLVYDTINAPEDLLAEASQDGDTFVSLGLGVPTRRSCSLGSPCVAAFDLEGSGLESASIFRLSVAGRIVLRYPQGFDLDAVEAVHFAPGALAASAPAVAVPEPAALALVGAGLLGATRRRRASA